MKGFHDLLFSLFSPFPQVSRWFGGVLLGPDRFRIISNSARVLLTQTGFGSEPIPVSFSSGSGSGSSSGSSGSGGSSGGGGSGSSGSGGSSGGGSGSGGSSGTSKKKKQRNSGGR